MRALVTGGAGFIGSHLVRRLVREGYLVVAADDCSTGHPANVPDGVELVVADLADPGCVTALGGRRFDVVCHLAGQSSGEKSFDNPVHDFDANARSTSILASWALEQGTDTFLHASSMSVYGQPSELPVSEEAPLAPLSFYGASKLAAERVLTVAGAQGMRTVSLRMFSVYGPGQDLSELRQGMVSIYLAYLLRREALPVTGSLDRVRDFVHVDDVTAAWQLAIDQPVRGAFNIGTGTGTEVRDLIERLILALGLPRDHPVRELPHSRGDQRAMFADCTRAAEELGWRPAVGLDEGIATLTQWVTRAEVRT